MAEHMSRIRVQILALTVHKVTLVCVVGMESRLRAHHPDKWVIPKT